MSTFEEKYNSILLGVEKPSRYCGGEFNIPDMQKPTARYSFCYCFPDLYEIGMSNQGIAILYDIFNKQSDWTAERCYAVKQDMADALLRENLPLSSLETKKPLKQFDVVGFSVQYELLYSNVLYMLDLAKIPFRAKDRDMSYPLIIAGGPCVANPAPFAEFFDAVIIGEGEEVNLALSKLWVEGRERGLSKTEILKAAKSLDGVYIPSLLERGERVKKAVVADFDSVSYPLSPLVPNSEAVHDRAVMELYRGCASGCRYCQAGFWYRPIREKSADTVVSQCKAIIDNTGFDELTLSSLSTGDYSHLKEVFNRLTPYVKKKHVNLALPSLRLSSFDGEMSENSRKSSLTFAPEAGTQRLRDVINKNVTQADIDKITEMFERGYNSVKLYFMLGLPTETTQDLDGIADICNELRNKYIQLKHRKDITISVSCAVFIPKPFTPFQWERQICLDEMKEKQNYLRGLLRNIKGVHFSWHGAESSLLEAVFARGDQKLSAVIERAYELGCRFDSWTEFFDWSKWQQAFADCGLNPEDYAGELDEESDLPWDFIDAGVEKSYLLKERRLSRQTCTTSGCREGCNGCGATRLGRCSIL